MGAGALVRTARAAAPGVPESPSAAPREGHTPAERHTTRQRAGLRTNQEGAAAHLVSIRLLLDAAAQPKGAMLRAFSLQRLALKELGIT